MLKDISAATDLPTERVANMILASGSLVASFDLEHDTYVARGFIDGQLERFQYPETWKQYPRADFASHKEQARPLVPQKPTSPEPSEARVGGRRSHGMIEKVDRSQKKSPSTATTKPSPSSTRAVPALDPVAVEGQKEAPAKKSSKSSKTSAKEPSAPGMTSTRHRVGFVGELWPGIIADCKDQFVTAFLKDTGAALGYQPETVSKIQCDDKKGDTVVTFHVEHPTSVTNKDVDHVLRNAPYDDVWKLYYTAESAAKAGDPVTTFHRVGFVGAKWGEIVDNDWDGFCNAFIADTAAALGTRPEDIRIVDYAVKDDIIVDFYATHPAQQTEEAIDLDLDAYEYPTVWAMYGEPANDIDRRRTSSVMKRMPNSRSGSLTTSPRRSMANSPRKSVGSLGSMSCPTCQRMLTPQDGEFPSHGTSPRRGTYDRPTASYLRSIDDPRTSTVPRTSQPFSALHNIALTYGVSPTRSPRGSLQHRAVAPTRSRSTKRVPVCPRNASTARPKRTNSVSRGHLPSLTAPTGSQRRASSASRGPRRINLRELEDELSKKQRERNIKEMREEEQRRASLHSNLTTPKTPALNRSSRAGSLGSGSRTPVNRDVPRAATAASPIKYRSTHKASDEPKIVNGRRVSRRPSMSVSRPDMDEL